METMSESEEIDIEEHDVLDDPAIKRIFPDISVIKKEIIKDCYTAGECYRETMSESEEIDIEEHDVLDDPAIKRIFPDLSVIKKEIYQGYDEAFNTSATPSESLQLEDLCEGDATTKESEPRLPNHFQSSTGFVDSNTFRMPKDTASLDALCQRDAITTDLDPKLQNYFQNINVCTSSSPFLTCHSHEASRYLHENVIILGSKPNLEFQEICDSSSRVKPKLIINNINNFLNSCKRYCKECLILFPKVHSFKLHMINMHLNKVNNQITFTGSKTVHSSDHNIGPNEVSQTEESTRFSCFHCQKLYANRSYLIEHLYTVLEVDDFGSSDRSARSANAKEQKEENFNAQLNEGDIAEDYHEPNVSYKNEPVNSCIGYSSQVNTDSRDLGKHILSEAIHPRRRSLRSVVRLAECDGDEIKKKKRQANSDPSQDEHQNTNKRLKKQDYKEKLNTVKTFNCHKKSRTEKSNNNNKKSSKEGKTKSDFKFSKKPSRSMFYKCFICSKYYVTYECFSRHVINDHGLHEVPEVSKVPFDSHCTFCSSQIAGINSYNVHLFKYHKNQLKRVHFPIEKLLDKKIHEKVDKKMHCALKSILYKCMQCDLFFLSSNAAIDHSNHLGITDTCKCPFCQRVFRSGSMELHKKQHSFSQSFTVHTLGGDAFGLVLYKCSDCTVHYSEENFLLHYPKCDTETPNSLYCKVCDILINRDDMENHLVKHKENKIQYCDFIIIESDMIDDRHTSKKTTAKTKNCKSDVINGKHVNTPKTKKYFKTRFGKKTRYENLENPKLAMSFCHTCKCFIYNVNLRMLHVQGKCGHMLKYVCKDCGLMLTTKIHETHKEYHKKQQISLHDFIFYDLKTEKRICPPIPDYPRCNSCGVHFLRNCDVRLHSCQEQDFITCNVCSMKLTEQAYKLHINFHSYSIPNVNTKFAETTLPADFANEISCLQPNLSVHNDSYIKNVMFSYTCKSCRLTVNTYDKVVQHCQDHYDSKVVLSNMHKCQNCTLTLLSSDYKKHNMLHLNGTFNMDSIKVIDFDPFYFRYNNDFWTNHIFAYVADEDISQILRNSIYMYESRLKMETIQPGWSNSVLYRCDKCQVFVDPQYLYMHAVKTSGKSCAEMRKHPCSFCGQNFVSLAYRTAHEKEHENKNVKLKSYKVVLYNKEEHETYNKIIFAANNRYVLYQCRNCERAVDKFERNAHKCDENNLKKCSACGLLLDKQDFDLHSVRHDELDKFNAQNIFVVMFGKPKLGNHERNTLRSSFSGTKLDYIMYQCKKCDICIRTKKCISEHVCVPDNSKCKCSKCGLYFSKPDLECHYEAHELDLDFDELSMNVITFDVSTKILHVASKRKLEENNDLDNKTKNTSTSSGKHEIVYKCICGLHFLEELNAQQHANICNARMKISKQSCVKCDLLFTPGELFNHLLKHHSNKTLQFKYNIILVSKKEKRRVKCRNK